MNLVREECWVVTDGTPGMENQCLGLAERLPLPIRTFRIAFREPWKTLAPRSIGPALEHLAPQSDRPRPPWPKLLIGCGRQSIPVSIAIKNLSCGKTFTVQCQHPRVRAAAFDLVIPPEHDRLAGANVFPIAGSPNRITPQRLSEARTRFSDLFSRLPNPRLAVLIGGDSRTHGKLSAMDVQKLSAALARLSREHGLMISSSRRTPRGLMDALRRALADTSAYIWDGTGSNPYFGMLAWADAFLVTGDSVNMICEAGSTGKPVQVLPVPGGRRRSRSFHALLQEKGVTRPFAGKIEQWTYTPLDETGRAAAHLQKLLASRFAMA